VALVDFLPKWAKQIVGMGGVWAGIVFALEDTFTEINSDRLQADANTVLAEANMEGLTRWGKDLRQSPRPGSTTDQYRGTLTAIYQGQLVNQEAYAGALDRWGMAYTLIEQGDASTLWDVGFYDSLPTDCPAATVIIVFADPYPITAPTTAQKADAIQRMLNGIADLSRARARGIQIIAYFPASLA
jgi:hypothetical protein